MVMEGCRTMLSLLSS
ncbi:MAG: hypothetical protein C4531_07425 [Desulfurivibrio sp.]|nr:MAG: hypothetical protein C4531_07425 [Desulfurivibrio sp.]